MIRQCPECRQRLTEFAVACQQCGWSLVESESSPSALPQRDNHRASPADPDASSVDLSIDHPQSEPLEINGSAPRTVDKTQPNGSASELLPPSEIELKIQKARELIAEEDFGKAAAYLNRAIADAPRERVAECYALRGYVLYRQGEVGRAEEECTRAIESNWEDANTYAWRAAARGEQRKWRLAFADLETACEVAGSDRDEYFHLMESYQQAAKANFQQRVHAGDDSADLFCERGWVYYYCSQLEKAERDFKQALSRESSHAWASLGLAMVYRQAGVSKHLTELLEHALAGDVECQRQALRICAQAHHANGNATAAHRDLALLAKLAGDDTRMIVDACRLRHQLGDHIMAIDRLTRLLDQEPDHYFASLVRGQGYEAIKNYPLAVRDYTRFLRFFPEHLDALCHRAACYLAMKKFARAHEDLDVAQAVDHNSYTASLLRAKLLLAENQLDAALTECEQVVRLDNRAQGFAVKAKIYHQLCDYSSAIEEYSRAIEMAHDDRERKAEYAYQRGTILYELEEFEAAFGDFEQASQLRPNHSGGWVWKAATASRLEKWPAAIESLEQAIAVRPAASAPYQKLGKPVAQKAIDFFDRQEQRGQAKVETFRQRGMAHQFLGNLEQAQRDFTISLGMEPDPDTQIRRGQVLSQQGQHEAAIEDFTRTIRQDRDNHWARYCRAIARRDAGQLSKAKSDLKKAIQIATEHPKYHLMLSEIRQAEGRIDKVLAALDMALMHDPTDPLTYRRRGTVHANAGNTLQAIRDFTHAFELDPQNYELLVLRGHALLKADQPSAALEDFEQALTHDPSLARAYSGRATVLASEEKLEYTLIWLTKAIHRFQEPRDLAEILFARGKVFVQMGRFAPAAADFSAVIELMRSDQSTVVAARHARALTNIQAQRYDKASKDYRRILKSNPGDPMVRRVLIWLDDPQQPRPDFLPPPPEAKRPTRPPVVRAGIRLDVDLSKRWQNDPPFDTWIVRTEDKKEYGPVHFNILETWIREGRIDIGMRLLRADWSKWKRVEKIFEQILPFHSATDFVDDFPGINV